MWELLVVCLFAVAVHAEKKGTADRVEAESQDAEECATAPGNPKSIEECRKARHEFDSCLSDNTIAKYTKKTKEAMKEVEEEAKSWHIFEGRSTQVISLALKHAGLVTKDAEGKGGNVLDQNAFTNLLDCPSNKKRMQDEANIPRGAVLTYTYTGKGGKVWTEMRMKTPRGCFASAVPLNEADEKHLGKDPASNDDFMLYAQKAVAEHLKKPRCLDIPGFKLTGIYVKNVN